jgi:hypothetical protein
MKEISDNDITRIYEAFEKEITNYLAKVEEIGGRALEIRTDYLYSRVEGFQCDSVKMLICMRVMKDLMLPGDEVIDEPDDFDGRFMTIKYQLPRKTTKRAEQNG